MTKWTCSATCTISLTTEVDAETQAEAILTAEERSIIGLCHQCASCRSAGEEWVTSGELDGEPVNIVAEKDE